MAEGREISNVARRALKTVGVYLGSRLSTSVSSRAWKRRMRPNEFYVTGSNSPNIQGYEAAARSRIGYMSS
jgi:surfactin synthase thioesterase subunit